MADPRSRAPQTGRPLLDHWQKLRADRGSDGPASAVALLHAPSDMSVRAWRAARGMVRLHTAQCGYRLLEMFDVTEHAIEVQETLVAVGQLMIDTGAAALMIAGPVGEAELHGLLDRSPAELVRLPYDGGLDVPHTVGEDSLPSSIRVIENA